MRTILEEAGRDWEQQPGGTRRLATLRVLCDTWAPPVSPPAGAPDLGGFWERRASDLRTHLAVAGHISTQLPETDQEGIAKLLDLLTFSGFRLLPQRGREGHLRTLERASEEIAGGLDGLRKLTMLHFYGLTDDAGSNPNWQALGYPGPPDIDVATQRTIEPERIDAAQETLDLDADVVIVGSGAGGGVIAGELARAGLSVMVLEAGGDAQDPDFPAYEIDAGMQLYWRGGFTPTDDANVTLAAGSTLGGGTTVNWTNCVRPPDHVRAEWEADHGIAGLAGADFDGHLEAVLERVGANEDCSDRNGPNARLAEAADALGWSWRCTMRNTDPATYDPETAGGMGFGDRSGSKMGVTKTYLADAVGAGARVVTGCHVDRVVVTAGRATGVEATITHPDGRTTALTVRAETVVVAGGALETPALLLRSGIGGPATGRHLRLHPVPLLAGLYDEDQRSWWGPPQATIVDEHAAITEGYGYLLEAPAYGAGILGATMPWRSGRDHKVLMSGAPRSAMFIAVTRDRGAGSVTVDEKGAAVVTYPLDDWLDREHLRHALGSMARAHVAAGAKGVIDIEPRRELWRRGDDVERFVERIAGRTFGAGGRTLFSAHQMGSARMGTDPDDSVADPDGQLHDIRGVWIGDTSAFPTAVGSNPMVTCMALARRTAAAIVAARAR